MHKSLFTRVLSVLLAVCMTLTALSVCVFAEAVPQLVSGTYLLDDTGVDTSTGKEIQRHGHSAYIVINAEAGTFHTLTTAADNMTEKGTGTIAYDAATGIYTVTYTADTAKGIGKTTAFCVTEDGSLCFVSPIFYGSALLAYVLTDENGNETGETLHYLATYHDSALYTAAGAVQAVDTTGKLVTVAHVTDTTDAGWEDYDITVAVTLDDDEHVNNIEAAGFTVNGIAKNDDKFPRFFSRAVDGENGLLKQLSGKGADEILQMTFSPDAATSATCTAKAIFEAVQSVLASNTAVFTEGTYTGVYEKESARGLVAYNITAVFENGEYKYDVWFDMGGTVYNCATIYGTYKLNGDQMTLTGVKSVDESGAEGTNVEGCPYMGIVLSDSELEVTGFMSSFAVMSGVHATTTLTLRSEEASLFTEGTYTGVYEKESARGLVAYNITAVFENGEYKYDVWFDMGGTVYNCATIYGTYELNGDQMTLTGVKSVDESGAEGTNVEGCPYMGIVLSDSELEVTGFMSSFAVMSGVHATTTLTLQAE
ncbi:MAG: hypothetical protein MJ136_06165 [Clostridia bacterium]|nr:hypothetical protein [Clostridia bacterium]